MTNPTDPEIILNLSYVHDDMGLIYSLRARCYLATGSDEEKLALLQRLGETDYLIAQVFPIPERFHTSFVTSDSGQRVGVVQRNALELVGGLEELFQDVYREMEKQLPAQTQMKIPQDPLVCITPLLGDDSGQVRPQYSGRMRIKSKGTVR